MEKEAEADGEAAAVGSGSEADKKTGADGLQAKIAEAMAGEEAQRSEVRDQEETNPDTEAQTPDEAEEADPELEAGKLQAGEVKGLSPEAQAKVNERIHEINVKRKDAESRATAAESKVSELEKRDAEVMRDAIRLGLAPEYVSKEEVAELKRYENLRLEKRWLAQHRDGYEGSGREGDPVLSADQVATREADIEDILADLAPRMKTLMRERGGQMLDDMKMGRNIRLRVGKKPATQRTPSALPGGGQAQHKKPAPGREQAGFSLQTFKEKGANKTALQEMIESKM